MLCYDPLVIKKDHIQNLVYGCCILNLLNFGMCDGAHNDRHRSDALLTLTNRD